jgi:hypothetical protein
LLIGRGLPGKIVDHRPARGRDCRGRRITIVQGNEVDPAIVEAPPVTFNHSNYALSTLPSCTLAEAGRRAIKPCEMAVSRIGPAVLQRSC